MNPKQTRTKFKGALAIAAIAALFAAACASVDTAPIRETMGKAELTINQAQGSGARQVAPLYLKRAEEKLNEAREAFEDENYTQARYLSDEALVEARLALSTSETAKTENTVEELRTGILQLRREIEQNEAVPNETDRN